MGKISTFVNYSLINQNLVELTPYISSHLKVDSLSLHSYLKSCCYSMLRHHSCNQHCYFHRHTIDPQPIEAIHILVVGQRWRCTWWTCTVVEVFRPKNIHFKIAIILTALKFLTLTYHLSFDPI